MPLRLRSAGGGGVTLNPPVALATEAAIEVPAYDGAKMLTDKTPGTVIQVAQGTGSGGATSTSTSYIDDGLEVSLTPKKVGNRIVIMVQSGCSVANGYAYFRILEAVSGQAVHAGEIPWGNFSGSPQQLSGLNILASYLVPDLSARTFKLQGKCTAGIRYLNYSANGLIVAMEIAQ